MTSEDLIFQIKRIVLPDSEVPRVPDSGYLLNFVSSALAVLAIITALSLALVSDMSTPDSPKAIPPPIITSSGSTGTLPSPTQIKAEQQIQGFNAAADESARVANREAIRSLTWFYAVLYPSAGIFVLIISLFWLLYILHRGRVKRRADDAALKCAISIFNIWSGSLIFDQTTKDRVNSILLEQKSKNPETDLVRIENLLTSSTIPRPSPLPQSTSRFSGLVIGVFKGA
jgi:hypothetical protein